MILKLATVALVAAFAIRPTEAQTASRSDLANMELYICHTEEACEWKHAVGRTMEETVQTPSGPQYTRFVLTMELCEATVQKDLVALERGYRFAHPEFNGTVTEGRCRLVDEFDV